MDLILRITKTSLGKKVNRKMDTFIIFYKLAFSVPGITAGPQKQRERPGHSCSQNHVVSMD